MGWFKDWLHGASTEEKQTTIKHEYKKPEIKRVSNESRAEQEKLGDKIVEELRERAEELSDKLYEELREEIKTQSLNGSLHGTVSKALEGISGTLYNCFSTPTDLDPFSDTVLSVITPDYLNVISNKFGEDRDLYGVFRNSLFVSFKFTEEFLKVTEKEAQKVILAWLTSFVNEETNQELYKAIGWRFCKSKRLSFWSATGRVYNISYKDVQDYYQHGWKKSPIFPAESLKEILSLASQIYDTWLAQRVNAFVTIMKAPYVPLNKQYLHLPIKNGNWKFDLERLNYQHSRTISIHTHVNGCPFTFYYTQTLSPLFNYVTEQEIADWLDSYVRERLNNEDADIVGPFIGLPVKEIK